MRHVSALIALSVWISACGSPPPDPPGDDAGPLDTVCTTDLECDDERFCNGPERCMPDDPGADARGCVATPPCMESQRCSEEEDRCVTSCAVDSDADGDGADAIECGGADCDDTDAQRFPGNAEVCDDTGHDEDCDGATFGARDRDGDTFVDAACCNGTTCGDDCGDSRRDAHPGATEACEGVDNDCDGAIDEMLLVRHYRDDDFDLHGVMATAMDVCPGTPGWSLVGDDCDDTSPIRHAAQLEICDGIDNDCDGASDEAPVSVSWYPDEDDDGFGAVPSDPTRIVISCMPVDGYSTRSSDCDDGDANVRPGQRELCNAVDDDCNGLADAPSLGDGDLEDDDDDGFADVACGGSDCDDAAGSVNRDAVELCNGVDDDCDGAVDGDDAMAMWYLDLDRDGWGDTSEPAITSCEPQPGRVARSGDCDDDDASIHPRTTDPCDGVDDDCDGSTDENGIRFAFYPDADTDGWGVSDRASIVFACTRPSGTSDRPGDCADTNPDRNPGEMEECDSIDEDCDMVVDEDAERMWYADADRDGHGVGAPTVACTRPAGYATIGDDCDDANAGNFPGNAEACNGRDDDCDTMVDDGASAACATLAHAGASTCGASGACTIVCDTGYGDCDTSPATGCETSTARSVSSCGTCGNACSSGDTCGLGTPGVCDEGPIVMLTSGEDYSMNTTFMALRAGGGVAAWGSASDQRSTFTSTLPQPATATGLTGIAEVHLGQEMGCARTIGRRVICWGQNDVGGLGSGVVTSSNRGPGEVILIDDAIALDTGLQHACVVREGMVADAMGEVWCWGWRSTGQTGNGAGAAGTTAQVQPTPAAVAGIDDAMDVYAGSHHSCAMRGPAGSRYVSCWGDNGDGKLGDGTTTGLGGAGSRVLGLPGNLVAFAHGSSTQNTCVITGDGRAFCWGSNSSAGLGLGGLSYATSALELTGPTNVVEVALGSYSGCARTATGEVWCWGYAAPSQGWIDGVTTGYISAPRRAGPVAMPVTGAIAIAAGQYRWCAALASGAVQCMGSDANGGLGNGPPENSHSWTAPVSVVGFP